MPFVIFIDREGCDQQEGDITSANLSLHHKHLVTLDSPDISIKPIKIIIKAFYKDI